MKILPPQYLYKFKTVDNDKQLEYILDILDNNRIYLPTYKELNDPLEGGVIDIDLSGFAGKWYYQMNNLEYPTIANKKEEYRILSLTDRATSPAIWAHYTSDYKGISLCYSTKNEFGKASPVIYRDKRETYYEPSIDFVTQLIESSFLYKQKDWAYEDEWRIIEKTNDKYFLYTPGDLAAIIIGSNLKERYKEKIVDACKNMEVPLFKVLPGYITASINILPYDSETPDINGAALPFINNLTSYLNEQTHR